MRSSYFIFGGAMRKFIFLPVFILMVFFIAPAFAGGVQGACTGFAPGNRCCEPGVTARYFQDEIQKPYIILACLYDPDATIYKWKKMAISREGKQKQLTVEQLQQFHTACQNTEVNFINCASACSRYCQNSCDAKGDPNKAADLTSRFTNCGATGPSGEDFNGGVFMGWYGNPVRGVCVCYN